ncbi:MAG: branched-chain amino acid ABC transporter permease [Calditrichaeota bacterium]|nr:branched-chain amino acid ABC transporter permease [Calditrichota bacterium]
MIFFLQLMVTGFVVGSVYALVALGFVLIYKSSRVINFAQGELVLVGAFVCLSLTTTYKVPFFLAFLLTMTVAVIVGLLIERFFLRPMIGEPVLSIIMLTIGLSSFLRGIVEIIWGTETRVFPPIFPSKPINFGGIVISQVYMWSFILAVLFLGIFTVFFKFTNEGIAMRAAADDEDAALSMGISIKKIYGLAWAIAALVAAVGGVVIGNINGVNISLSMMGLRVFPVVILGGLDSIPGAIIGGLAIGILENLAGGYLDPFFGGGVKEIFPFIILVLVLMIKPYGLFGLERIERV